MAKPIALMYWPIEMDMGNGSTLGAGQMMGILNGLDDKYKADLIFQDYLWLVVPKPNISEPELKVFHEKDFTDIQYEELKAMVKEGVESINKKDSWDDGSGRDPMSY
jgi:hypothetical protein